MVLDEHPLWRYAQVLYARPGVEQTCLRLQDEQGRNVNLLLWACWLGRSGVLLPGSRLDAARAALAGWDAQVRALRAVRRAMRERIEPVPEVWRKRVRTQVQAAELAAEQVELGLLAGIAEPARRQVEATASAAAIRANLSACADGRWCAELDELLAAAVV